MLAVDGNGLLSPALAAAILLSLSALSPAATAWRGIGFAGKGAFLRLLRCPGAEVAKWLRNFFIYNMHFIIDFSRKSVYKGRILLRGGVFSRDDPQTEQGVASRDGGS